MKKLLLSLLFLSALLTTASSQVVISEVYGGGGNTGAFYKNDFIELYNAGDSPIDLTGWSVQYASAAGTSWQKTALTGSIPAKGYYLIQQAAGTGVASALPAPDAVGAISMSGTAGKVALCANNIALTVGNPSPSSYVDFVGFGTANHYEGFGLPDAGAAPTPSNTVSIERIANASSSKITMSSGGADEFGGNGYDNNFNKTDFVTRAPEPQNTASLAEPVEAAPTATAFSPEDNSINIALNTNPSVIFSENIAKGSTGNITVENLTDGSNQVISVNSPDVAINGSTLTLNNVILLNSKSYAIRIDATAIKDNSGNFFAGISDLTTWNFSTVSDADVTPPTIISLIPANGGINADLNTPVSLTFSENIQKGTGTISISNLTAGTVQVIDIMSSAISISNNILTISGIAFENKSSYAVQVSAGSIKDMAPAPNDFAGIIGNSSWAFSIDASPVAVNDVFSLFNEVTFNGNLATNDSDPNGMVLTYTKLTDPVAGTLTVNADGTFSYVPLAGSIGSQTFTYRVSNPNNFTADATVTLNISERPKIIISQYYEGGGTNKWIELTNLSGTEINTSSAQLQLVLYGVSGDGMISNFTSSTPPSQKVNLSVSIPAYGSVLIGNSGNGTEIPYLTAASANQIASTVINFNGNDGVALLNASNAIVDGFGQGINAKDVSYVRNPGATGSSTFIAADWSRQTLVTVQNAVDSDDPDRLGVHIAPNLPECVSPAIAATNLNFNAANFTSISGTFSAAAGTSDYLVIRSTEPVFNGIPVDGVVYTAGSSLGNGIVVSSGPASTFTAAGLANGTTYYITVFSFNATGCVGGPLYYTASYLAGSSTTTTPEPCVVPANQPTNFRITSSSYNYIQGSFTETAADEYLVVMSTSNTLSSNPVNGHVYVPGESLGGGTVVKRGAGNSFLKTGLSGGTAYYFSVFALNSDCGSGPVYQTLAPLMGSATTGVSSAGNLNYYFGNLHAHSSSSDGNKDDLTKTPADNFAFAKSALYMDFLGISEHNHTGAGMDLADWQPGVNAARASSSSSFVGMYGMEWGTISGGGHVLVYGIDSLIGWEPGQNQIYVPKGVYTGNTGLFRIVNRHGNNAIGMLAHPNTTDYNNLLGTYDADADLAIVGSAVESGPAFSTNVTYSDPGSPMSYLDYYQKMLSKGYHIGPSIDHDNHNYTFGKTAKSRLVVLAPSLSESELLNSLKQMRFYATEDYGAQVSFTINSQPLGSELTAANAPNISVNAITTTGIRSIKIFYGQPGSGVVPVELTSSASGNLNYTDNALANLSTGYYYADITAIDSTRTLTSPIWYTRDDTALPPKKNQNITFAALAPKVYGDGDFDPAASSDNGSIAITYSSSDQTVASIVNNQVHIVSAGTVSITANQAASSAYNAATPQSQTLTITAKPITVTANAQTKVYGEADPAFTFTTSPALVNNDSLRGTLSRITGENAGTYAINQGDLANSNYILSFEPSDMTINAKAITVTAEANTKVYGDADPALTYTSAETLIGVDAFTGALARAAGESTGNYAISQGDLSLSNNYVLSFQPSTFTITAKAITVTAEAKMKVYGTADPALTYTSSETLISEDAFTGSLARAAGESAGTYAISQGNLSLSDNYTLNFQPSTLTITAKAIILSAEAKTKVYGDADPVLTYLTSETLPAGSITGALSRAAGENAGAYAINQGDLSVSGNYSFSFQSSALTITAKALTIAADDKTRVQGIENPALTLTYAGFVNGETAGVLSTPAVVNTAASPTSPTGTYPIEVSGAVSNNYAITYRNGTLTVVPGTPTVLSGFDARVSGTSIRVTWTTLSEYRNDYFAIERSRNGKKFEELSRVKGSFYSDVPIDYVAYDDAPYNGNSYYRLKQTNLDGTFTYSKVVGVKFSDTENYKLLIYPNPVQNNILLSFVGKQPNEQVLAFTLINANGGIVLSGKGSLSSLNELLNASVKTLSPGIYVVHLNGTSLVSTAKFIKQ